METTRSSALSAILARRGAAPLSPPAEAALGAVDDKPRGHCRVCGKDYVLRKSGLVPVHESTERERGIKPVPIWIDFDKRCPGVALGPQETMR